MTGRHGPKNCGDYFLRRIPPIIPPRISRKTRLDHFGRDFGRASRVFVLAHAGTLRIVACGVNYIFRTLIAIIYLPTDAQNVVSRGRAMSKPSKRAGAPEVPDDVLMISYRVLLAGSGWEQPDLADHKEAARELLSVLLDRGWTISPPASCILHQENTTNPKRK